MPNQKYPPEAQREAMLPKTPGNRRPLISCFAGIFVRMEYGDTEQRLHAEYGGDMAVFDFDGQLLRGEFPAKQRMYISVWADIRRHDLQVLWELMRGEDAYFPVRGLEQESYV